MTSKENGKNVYDLQWLIGLYNPKQMLFKKIPIDDFIVKEMYNGQMGSSSTAAEGNTCAICLENFSDGEEVGKMPCNVRISFIINIFFFFSTFFTLTASLDGLF
jgi:hypothetical protein